MIESSEMQQRKGGITVGQRYNIIGRKNLEYRIIIILLHCKVRNLIDVEHYLIWVIKLWQWINILVRL